MDTEIKTFRIETYGCALNHADSLKIKKVMTSHGWHVSKEPKIIIINTCGVKHSTEQKIIFKLRTYYEQGQKVIVTGCLGHDVKLIHKTHPKASILGVKSTQMFADTAEKLMQGIQVISIQGQNKENIIAMPSRTLMQPIAIQEGCTNNCSYCFTKFARPHLVSYPLENIIQEVNLAIENGVKEIQLTGQDTGAYIYKDMDSADVINQVLQIHGDFMVRLGMINPLHATRLFDKLMDVYENTKMFKFFHLPVQSGSNEILKHMRRRYTIEQFKKLYQNIRKHFPESIISTDIIIGYPTETEHDFEQSLELIKELRFDIINISRYSPRPFTDAAKLNKLSTQVIKARTQKMTKVFEEILNEKNKTMVGKRFNVLVLEKGNKKGQVKARTKEYKQVIINENIGMGKWIKVKIIGTTNTSLIGELV